LLKTEGERGHGFSGCSHTENQNQMSFFPFDQHEISVLIKLILGHLRYGVTDVPPQPKYLPETVLNKDNKKRGKKESIIISYLIIMIFNTFKFVILIKENNKIFILLILFNSMSKISFKVVVFQDRNITISPTYSTPLKTPERKDL